MSPRERESVRRATPREIRLSRNPLGFAVQVRLQTGAVETAKGLTEEQARETLRRAVLSDVTASFNPARTSGSWVPDDAIAEFDDWAEADPRTPLTLTPPKPEDGDA